jgi:hypothetical protein
MKKLLLILLTVALAVTLAFALTSCGGPTIKYELSEDGTYYIVDQVRFKAPDSEVVIAEEYKGLPVKAIGEDAFIAEMNDSFIAKLTVPGSVTVMADYIGELCRYQQGSDTSEFVTDVYYGGTEQQWFTMMDGGNCKYYNLYINETLVTSATIPADMNVIPEEYANGCLSLKEVILPNTVTAVGIGAFDECFNLETITIPETVGSIGGSAFSECYGLTTLNYNAANATVGDADDNNRRYNNGAFYGMGRNSTGVVVNIGKSVEVLPDYLFKSSDSSSYTGPNVKKIVIDNECNFKKIGRECFANTLGENSEFTTEGGLVYVGSENNPYMFCGGSADLNITTATIKDTCLYILDVSFMNCDKLEAITIPASVQYIGRQAFYGTEVTFESTTGWKIVGTNQAANLLKISIGYTADEYSCGITKMN